MLLFAQFRARQGTSSVDGLNSRIPAYGHCIARAPSWH